MAVLLVRGKRPRYELARYHYQKALDLGAEPDPQIEAMLKGPAEKSEPAKTEPAPVEQPKTEEPKSEASPSASAPNP